MPATRCTPLRTDRNSSETSPRQKPLHTCHTSAAAVSYARQNVFLAFRVEKNDHRPGIELHFRLCFSGLLRGNPFPGRLKIHTVERQILFLRWRCRRGRQRLRSFPEEWRTARPVMRLKIKRRLQSVGDYVYADRQRDDGENDCAARGFFFLSHRRDLTKRASLRRVRDRLYASRRKFAASAWRHLLRLS